MLVLLAKSSTGKLTRLQLDPDATVGQLKRELAARFCPDAGAGSATPLRVRAGDRLLAPDDARLRELGVASQQLLHVSVDPAGGVASQASAAPHRDGDGGVGLGAARAGGSAHGAVAGLDEQAWGRLSAKVDALASELEGWTREQIDRLQASGDSLLERLSQLELRAGHATDNSAKISEMHAKLQALEARGAAHPARIERSLSPGLAARLEGLDEKLESVQAADRRCSCAAAVEELRLRLRALENRPPSTTHQDSQLAVTAAEVSHLHARVQALEEGGLTSGKEGNQPANADPSGSGAAGVESRLTDLESSMRTLEESKLAGLETSVKGLEEKVKDLRKLSQQIIKQQRQRAVAQGVNPFIHTYMNKSDFARSWICAVCSLYVLGLTGAAPRIEESEVQPKGVSHKERMQRNREMKERKERDLLTSAVREKHVCEPS